MPLNKGLNVNTRIPTTKSTDVRRAYLGQKFTVCNTNRCHSRFPKIWPLASIPRKTASSPLSHFRRIFRSSVIILSSCLLPGPYVFSLSFRFSYRKSIEITRLTRACYMNTHLFLVSIILLMFDFHYKL